MKNSADLGGCYPPRPKALVDNTLLDLQNSSYPTQPYSIIAKYFNPAKLSTRFCFMDYQTSIHDQKFQNVKNVRAAKMVLNHHSLAPHSDHNFQVIILPATLTSNF